MTPRTANETAAQAKVIALARAVSYHSRSKSTSTQDLIAHLVEACEELSWVVYAESIDFDEWKLMSKQQRRHPTPHR